MTHDVRGAVRGKIQGVVNEVSNCDAVKAQRDWWLWHSLSHLRKGRLQHTLSIIPSIGPDCTQKS